MRILAIETASEACSVALFDGAELIAHEHRVLGRGHAEALVPMIAALPDKGRADRILGSLGPGSFTGVRIGIASARALGFAWGAQVRGFPTLALVAAGAWEDTPTPVTVCMNGGHGEWFVQNFGGAEPQDQPRSLTPEEAAKAALHPNIIGNRAEELAAMLDGANASNAVPDARHVMRLPEGLLTENLSPLYGRAPDAKPAKAKPAKPA